MSRVFAKELFEFYPHSETCSLEEPTPNETIPEYCRRVGYDNGYIEDGMMAFLLAELAEVDRDEAIGCLDGAVSDLLEVRDQLAAATDGQTVLRPQKD